MRHGFCPLSADPAPPPLGCSPLSAPLAAGAAPTTSSCSACMTTPSAIRPTKPSAPYHEALFAAGSSWLCFTDQVVHAALAGQYALEHTFYLPVEAMAEPDNSPLRILERMTRQKLG